MKKTLVSMDRSGRILIPGEVRLAMGLKEGDQLVLVTGAAKMHLFTQSHAIPRAQAIVHAHVPDGTSLVDELLEERQEDATLTSLRRGNAHRPRQTRDHSSHRGANPGFDRPK